MCFIIICSPNKCIFCGLAGLSRGLDSLSRAQICARGLVSVASRGLQWPLVALRGVPWPLVASSALPWPPEPSRVLPSLPVSRGLA